MNKILIWFLFLNSIQASLAITPSEIISSGDALKKGTEIVSSLGLNCADPANAQIFVNELYRILEGLGFFLTELGTQKAYSKNFPNVCHVLTQNQHNSYTENKNESGWKCVARKPLTRACLAEKKTSRPKPQYWWPKYFVEVTKKGFDSHPSFARNNKLYELNRKLASKLRTFVDADGAIKITQYVLGLDMALKAANMSVGEQEWGSLIAAKILTPFEGMRMRSNSQSTLSSFEANLWPVVLSQTLASHLTVCGPKRAQVGQNPGGYAWPIKGVAQTCPIAMSSDAFAYWDTGMIDYLDPVALGAMAISSNPFSCAADMGMKNLASLGENQGPFQGETDGILNALGSVSGDLSKGMRSCSWPIMGKSEALVKKVVSLTQGQDWKKSQCTFWGSIFPRMSTSVYENDYSYANTALKFKMLAHDLFGVPRGQEERWSLAYPWEEGSGNQGGFLGDFLKEMNGQLKEMGFDLPGVEDKGRSEGLFIPGHPVLVNATTSAKHMERVAAQFTKEHVYLKSIELTDPMGMMAMETKRLKAAEQEGVNDLSGDKRVYTIWEKIDCVSDSVKESIKTGPVVVNKYENCHEAIKFEVYKYIQTSLLRKICDLAGEKAGEAFK